MILGIEIGALVVTAETAALPKFILVLLLIDFHSVLGVIEHIPAATANATEAV